MPAMKPNPPLVHRLLIFGGSLGPFGHMPASGTVTVAAVGIPIFYLTRSWGAPLYLTVLCTFTLASVALHQVGDRILGEKDSRRLVWDELVGFMVAVTLIPFTWQTVVAAFLLERLIDIVKVPPANIIERAWPGGWGVVGDDVIAGLYTWVILQGLCRFAGPIMGLPA